MNSIFILFMVFIATISAIGPQRLQPRSDYKIEFAKEIIPENLDDLYQMRGSRLARILIDQQVNQKSDVVNRILSDKKLMSKISQDDITRAFFDVTNYNAFLQGKVTGPLQETSLARFQQLEELFKRPELASKTKTVLKGTNHVRIFPTNPKGITPILKPIGTAGKVGVGAVVLGVGALLGALKLDNKI